MLVDKFQMNDLGKPRHFLGINFKQSVLVSYIIKRKVHIALDLTVEKCLHLQNLLKNTDRQTDYEYTQTIVHEDNQGTIALAKNPINRQQSM